jgi:hypothetical protein
MKLGTVFTIVTALGTAVLAGCGGGGGSSAPPTAVISGVASKGPISAGTVQVFAIDANGVAATTPLNVATVATDKTKADGSYSVNIGNYTGAVLVEVREGSYVDEATGATKNLAEQASSGMRAVVASVTAGATSTVAVTPLTELAARKIEKSGTKFTVANINQANGDISSFFKVQDIITTSPANMADSSSRGATAAQKDYGVALATVSQLLKNKNETLGVALEALGTEMTKTGGLEATTLVDINTATQNFLAGANNLSGVTADTVKPIVPTGGVLKLQTNGTLAAGSSIGGLDVTLTLPASLTIATDSFGQPTAGVVVLSGAAAEGTGAKTNSITNSRFDATTGKLRLLIANPSGMGVGEFITINFGVAATVTTIDAFPKATDFAIGATQVVDANAAAMPAITASVSSFTVQVK